MASLRQLRSRIRSIQSTKQIMRAMQLVAGSKLKRTQNKMVQGRAVLGFLDGLLQRVLASSPGLEHPLCAAKSAGAAALVLFTSDTGLCGSYNTNLITQAENYLRRDTSVRPQMIYIGKKGHRYFTKRGYAPADSYLNLAGRPNSEKGEAIAKKLIGRFLKGELASVDILFSTFKSATVYRPIIWRWLPIQLDRSTARPLDGKSAIYYIFEPSASAVFEDLLPRWAIAKFQLAMLEAFTSEHSARMIAMKNATDNAQTILKELTLLRNRIRQAGITKEISEIVGTAEALK